ncbi:MULTISPECIES: protein NO VEIN domain-containing protein [unclassified Agarivorans]|uniref:protein NO VEIN domain-containing protein n=1 Tax=unclassified Agarivorans TaxID=2636026 RepID=UPI0026E2EEC2|nr:MULTISPECIES: DUF3883 domain-containing protein [unclassified Agarivorans]MDO6686725.1 DUF3883 domain-containing protein [Agarivorans sp. 3_MG-2023]MDO6716545.1 DUF3883 domain-containing protein [Agarivorans sp. 2_MG-2023]
MEKIAIKRLSSSDLTLFNCHFDPKAGTRQKAWNLDKKIFLEQMYPTEWGDEKHNVTLALNGPDGSLRNVLERKIVRQQKNMRLNGELVNAHESGNDRYALLQNHDYAVMVFNGAPFPTQIEAFLIANSSSDDNSLHKAITQQFSKIFNQHRSMVEITRNDVRLLLDSSNMSVDYPLQRIFDDALIEDAVQGGIDGFKKLRVRRKGRFVSEEELANARENANATGKLGERLVNEYFIALEQSSKINNFEWVAESNPISPFDFTLTQNNSADEHLLDVKTTKHAFHTKIHISIAELLEARDSRKRYDIYRVYEAADSGARMRISEDIGNKASEIISSIDKMPFGVTCDSVTIDPSILDFGEEIILEG